MKDINYNQFDLDYESELLGDDTLLSEEELSYQFGFLQIQKELIQEWEKLKPLLPEDNPEIKKIVKKIDKLINYYYE